MLTSPDFSKKQIVFVFCNEGEKLAIKNDNLIVKDINEKIKAQISCYRLFLIYVVGHCSLTSVFLQRAKQFGFFVVLMSSGFRINHFIGAEKEGNTLLKQNQYLYSDIGIAKHLVRNKIANQLQELKSIRYKNDMVKESIETLKTYLSSIEPCQKLCEILAYEGLSAKLYFRNFFQNVVWKGRQPRLKKDYINSALDMGYTMLFTFIDALLMGYGFDTFCGVLHRQFYMRKSLTCDIIEPFRVIIDHVVKKAISLQQIKEEDFLLLNQQYKLKWECNTKYAQIFLKEIILYKNDVFSYIQGYYRAFMKNLSPEQFPFWKRGDTV